MPKSKVDDASITNSIASLQEQIESQNEQISANAKFAKTKGEYINDLQSRLNNSLKGSKMSRIAGTAFDAMQTGIDYWRDSYTSKKLDKLFTK